MALIVEDGSIVAGANSYESLVNIGAYHTARENTAWAGTTAQEEGAVLRAMGFLESLAYQGTPVLGPVGGTDKQALSFPRANIILDGYTWDYTEIPPGLKTALCEAALIERVTPGALAPDLSRGGKIKRQKVDVIETEYFDGAPALTSYATITQALKGLVISNNIFGGGLISSEMARI